MSHYKGSNARGAPRKAPLFWRESDVWFGIRRSATAVAFAEIWVSGRADSGTETSLIPMKEQSMYIGLGTLIVIILILLFVF